MTARPRPADAAGDAPSLLTRVSVRFGVRIPMRDGTELDATLYLPTNRPGALPSLFTLTPYVAQTYHDRAMMFAERGYAFLTVDVRGRGNSDGSFVPFKYEGADGYDIVEWIAAQPFSNGKVAMWGGSYGGFAQWAAAVTLPPHLVSIVPVASPCLGVDLPGRSNMPLPYMMQWLTLVRGRASQDQLFWNKTEYWGAKFADAQRSGAAFNTLDEQFGFASPTFQEWLAHPEQEPYWDAYNPSFGDYTRLTLPILTITGAYDGDQPGALTHWRRHQTSGSPSEHYLIIGPWDHAGTRVPRLEFCGLKMGPESLLDLQQLHLDWYAWTMGTSERPAFLKDKVAYYVAGADRWRYAATLEATTAEHLPLHLCTATDSSNVFSSGRLLRKPAPSGRAVYQHDPADVRLAELESKVDPGDRSDQRMVLASLGRQLVFHSEPFEHPTEITGFFTFEASMAIDRPDTDFRASVYEIRSDGTSVLLSSDSLRARYRQGLDSPVLIDTTDPLPFRFERFTFVSREIAKGSRLRFVLGAINSIYSQKNYNSGRPVAEQTIADAQVVTVTLHHDETNPAILHVPLGLPTGPYYKEIRA